MKFTNIVSGFLSAAIMFATSGLQFYAAANQYAVPSTYSDSASIVFPGVAPSNVSGLSGDGEAFLCWDDVSNRSYFRVYSYNSVTGKEELFLDNITTPYCKLTGLTNGQTYNFSVCIVCNENEWDHSQLITVVPQIGQALFKPPSEISGTKGTDSVTLSWDPIVNATSYKIYYSTLDSGSFASCYTSTTANSCTVSGLSSGNTYYFWVTAYYPNNEESSMGNSVSFTPGSPSKPQTPGNISYIAGDTQALLYWDAVANAEKYNIYIDDYINNTGKLLLFEVTDTYRMITKMDNDYEYKFYVSAVVDGVESELSECITVVSKEGAEIIKSVSGIKGTTGTNSVTLSWNPVEGVRYYKVYCSQNDNRYTAVCRTTTTSTSTVISGLTSGTAYYFWVTAYYPNNEESSMGNSVSFTPGSPSKPQTPGNISYIAGDTQALLYWDAVANAEKYNIYIDDYINNTGKLLLFEVTDTYRMITKMDNDYEYKFYVSAVVDGVESELSECITVVSKEGAEIIKSVSGIKGTTGTNSVTLSWNPVEGVRYYKVYCSQNDNRYTAVCRTTTTSTSTVISGLTSGTAYYFWVTAYYPNNEESSMGNSVSFTPGGTSTPTAPSGLNALYGDSEVMVYWNPVSGAEKYSLYSYNGSRYVHECDVTTPYKVFTSLTNNCVYKYAVSVTVNGIESPKTGYYSITPLEGAELYKAPKNVTSIADDSKVTIGHNIMSGISSYKVYCSTSNNINTASVYSFSENSSTTVTSLNNGTTYYFWLSAVYLNGIESAAVGPVTAVPTDGPTVTITSQPSLSPIIGGVRFTLSVSTTGDSMLLLWEYNDGGVWTEVPQNNNIKVVSSTNNSYITVYDSTEFNNVQFRCVIFDTKGREYETNTVTVRFQSEEKISASSISYLSINDTINYVNYFTSLDTDTNILTDAQLEAIDRVLEHDFS